MSEKYVFKTVADLEASTGRTADDLIEVFQGGKSKKILRTEALKFDSYDVKVGSDTTLSLEDTVAVINNSTITTKTIMLPAVLPANRGRTFVVVIKGAGGSVEWDPRINWSGGTPPTLAANVTVGVLLWDGTSVHGSNGASY